MSTSDQLPTTDYSIPEFSTIIELVVERTNMTRAYVQVVKNKGAPGIDDMPVSCLKRHLDVHWAAIKQAILEGKYQPQAVRQVEIPKATGGKRKLGIPTVVDRLIQQALHQVLSPLFEPHFSNHSYGFRQGKNAHQAVEQAREYQSEGYRWVVDMDLEKFFDQVNHDVLISLIRRRVNDSKILRLIRSYLTSGIMVGGLEMPRREGTPQGSPLSPLLSNIMLNELDRELTNRGHRFVRYADDCNIYVKSERAGSRVLESIGNWLETKLRLKVNKEKSAVSRPSKRKFLGFSFTGALHPLIRVPKETVRRFRKKLKILFRQGRGRNVERFIRYTLNPVLRGWANYFRLSETKLFAKDLDRWVRRRLRLILWRQWKRSWTRKEKLMKLGLGEEHAIRSAFNGFGPWWNSGSSHMNLALPVIYFRNLKLVELTPIVANYQK